MTVNVIGAGLAGCECAWQLARRGVKVNLYEMKPKNHSPAHHLNSFAELVCSNSLRGAGIETAPGLLKEEMRRLSSLIIETADETKVPAGGALAVDRNGFSEIITERIKNNPFITVIEEEITDTLPDGITVIATGPLTSDPLFDTILSLTGGKDFLHFFDAAAPVVMEESLDMEKVYRASRYDKGEAAYLNCPMSEEEYNKFYDALISAECAEWKEFEKINVFEGCMPVEIMAKRGRQTLLFGPLKPVGLPDPKTGKEPYAVVQLRQDNKEGTLYNLVGFQTHLKFGEQKRVFSMIPGLQNAEFARYGVMHRNTYINSPKLLDNTYRMRENENLYFAGQITGVEGYIESAASGMLVGIYLGQLLTKGEIHRFSDYTAIASLANYVSDSGIEKFQPMNINFGIIPSLEERFKGKKRDKNLKIALRALETIDQYIRMENL
ncbi:MAG: methylenetetrahydrofolate--tRNA-(uracil(54)-C(5))-methyltransferase (FADH(2)-oxidizing) TrmFO [Clostridia bacterium]|nr:methylenetetrahydrofolate--tRNA-(uracil(54)-C(5))-methyltransferase (FADH(2)-oxidizing) TrmFO [Clostridia bacterium]